MKHTRPLSLVSLAASLLLAACSQTLTPQASELVPQFGSGDRDIGVDVLAMPDGGATSLSYQTGRPPGDESDITYTRSVVRRYNAAGTFLWETYQEAQRSSGDYTSLSLNPRALITGPQGDIYTLQSRNSIANDSVNINAFSVQRYTPSGVAGAGFRLGTTGTYFEATEPASEHANAVALTADGTALYATFETIDLDDLSYYNVVGKYAPNGRLLWQRESTVGTPYGSAVTSNGLYVIGKGGLARYSSGGDVLWTKTGTTYSVGAYAKLVSVDTNLVARNLDTIRKYDASGRLIWSKNQAGLDTLVIQDVSADSGGNIFVSGKFNAGGGNFNAFVRKLNSSGTTVWTKTYGTPKYDDARGVTSLNGSAIFVAGETQGPLTGSYQGGESDAYLRKLNSAGNPVWTR